MLTGSLDREQMAEHALTAFLAAAPDDASRVACELLELTPSEDDGYHPHAKMLRARARTSEGGRLQAALALAFGIPEAALRKRFPSYGAQQHVHDHFALLTRAQYPVTDAEKDLIRAYGASASDDESTTVPDDPDVVHGEEAAA